MEGRSGEISSSILAGYPRKSEPELKDRVVLPNPARRGRVVFESVCQAFCHVQHETINRPNRDPKATSQRLRLRDLVCRLARRIDNKILL